MMGLFELSIRNPIVLSVAILLVALFGLIAVFRVPVQMTPDVEERVITVLTRWPGATPQDVEKEIVIEQEEYLQNVPGLGRMISRASMGSVAPIMTVGGSRTTAMPTNFARLSSMNDSDAPAFQSMR